jgi:hypothetical protein
MEINRERTANEFRLIDLNQAQFFEKRSQAELEKLDAEIKRESERSPRAAQAADSESARGRGEQ